jgi:hypothetical protein
VTWALPVQFLAWQSGGLLVVRARCGGITCTAAACQRHSLTIA